MPDGPLLSNGGQKSESGLRRFERETTATAGCLVDIPAAWEPTLIIEFKASGYGLLPTEDMLTHEGKVQKHEARLTTAVALFLERNRSQKSSVVAGLPKGLTVFMIHLVSPPYWIGPFGYAGSSSCRI